MKRRTLGRWAVVALSTLLVAVLLAFWFVVPASIPAGGRFHGFDLDTTVDSGAAKYYIESYAQGLINNTDLHRAIETFKRQYAGRVPTAVELRQISRAHSVDFAALFFADQVLSLERNREINRRFSAHVERVLRREPLGIDPTSILVVLVPGYDYQANGHVTGADLRTQVRILNDLGFQVEFIAVDPLGTVAENARVVEATLRRLDHDRVVIAGPSSAGPAIQTTLSRLGTDSGVVAWLNLGGTLRGVPLLDWLERFPQRLVYDVVVRKEGWRLESFESLTTRVLRERYEALSVPDEIQVFNYISMSLSGDISRFGWDKYLLMRSMGPNDGLSLLPDLLVPEGRTIVSPQGDHFFAEDPLIEQKSVALLLTVLESLAGREGV